jgi:hypothetical protein
MMCLSCCCWDWLSLYNYIYFYESFWIAQVSSCCKPPSFHPHSLQQEEDLQLERSVRTVLPIVSAASNRLLH